MKRTILLLTILLGSLLFTQSVNAAGQSVLVLEIEGVINPLTSRYIERGINLAVQQNVEIIVITLNTPGGLETSMREIVQSFLDSPIPIAVFVAPTGARASSAGLFLLLAGDFAAMSPATNIGAATPVALDRELDEVMSQKSISDAAALIRGLAEKSDRNVEWAEAAVRESLSLTASEALAENVIDFIADDLNDLLNQLDGQAFEGGMLDLSDPSIQTERMNWVERFYHVITEPNIAYLLLSLGTLFLIAEISDPGLSFAGIGAVISFVIGFMALGSLPVNWAAMGLLALSVIMFVVALLTDTEVIVTIAGLIPFVLGSLLLFTPFRPSSPVLPELRVSLWLIIVMAILIVFFSLVILRAILQASKRPPRMGVESLIGKQAQAVTDLTPNGEVMVDHQPWSATSLKGDLPAGSTVEIVNYSGVRLLVVLSDHEEGKNKSI